MRVYVPGYSVGAVQDTRSFVTSGAPKLGRHHHHPYDAWLPQGLEAVAAPAPAATSVSMGSRPDGTAGHMLELRCAVTSGAVLEPLLECRRGLCGN